MEAQLENPFDGPVPALAEKQFLIRLLVLAALVIFGAGSTCWELCLLAVPAIVLAFAENRTQIAKIIANKRAVVAADFRELGTLEEVSHKISQFDAVRRATLSASARRILDGRGPVVGAIASVP